MELVTKAVTTWKSIMWFSLAVNHRLQIVCIKRLKKLFTFPGVENIIFSDRQQIFMLIIINFLINKLECRIIFTRRVDGEIG